MNLILFLSPRTLNLKNIQGVYSYTHSANFKSVNAPFKKINKIKTLNRRDNADQLFII